jgi:pyruvate/2-oxoglutarate dehydrogenase complex dihydrolipoamide dehydrogenase (E3) component
MEDIMMTQKTYQAVVIGAGAAGLTAAGTLGSLGIKTALIERELVGGDCTWTGCMPSKALLHVAKMAHHARMAGKYGVMTSAPTVDFGQVRAYIRGVIDEIYQHETPEAFSKAYGVDVILGDAQFLDANTIRVGDERISAKRFIIGTGARTKIPPIDGLMDIPYLTNKSLWEMETLPKHLMVIGASAMGMEMAQAFRRLGCDVTVMDTDLLPREEPETRVLMERIFTDEEINIARSQAVKAWREGGNIHIGLADGGVIVGDKVLLATGRIPNTDLGLEKAGVAYTADGIGVDDFLRTNIKHIYAVGDCTTGAKYTHYASFQGGMAGRNAVLPIKSNGHRRVIPHVVFTDPEVAQVGMTEAEAREKYGDKVKIFRYDMDVGDRAICEDDTTGFIKLVYKGSGELLGATVVCDRAGEMILEYTLAVEKKVSLSALNTVLHAYPTYHDMSRRPILSLNADELFKSRLGKGLRWLLKRLL